MVVLSREDIIKLYLRNKDLFQSKASTPYYPMVKQNKKEVESMNQEENKETYVKYHKDENGNLHRLDGPAVEYLDGSGVVDYWVHGIRINQNSTYKAVQELFNNNKGLPNKIFKETKDFIDWSLTEEYKTYMGLYTVISAKEFGKLVKCSVSSNNSAAKICPGNEDTGQISYVLNGYEYPKEMWEEKRKEVFESDFDELISKFKSLIEIYKDFKFAWYSIYRGNNAIYVRDYQDNKIFDFNLSGKLLSQTYYEDYTFDKKITHEEHLNLRSQTSRLFHIYFDREIKIIEKFGYKQIDLPEYFSNGSCLIRFKQKETEEILQGSFDTKTQNFKLKIGNKEFRSEPNLKLDLENFLKKGISLTTKIFSYKNEFFIEKTQIRDNTFIYYFCFPKQNMSYAHFGDLKKNLSQEFEFKCLLKDHNLNEEEFLKEIEKSIPEFNTSQKELFNKLQNSTVNPPSQSGVSNKTKEIAKRVAVKRISGVVASLVIQHVFGNLKKPEHQTIKNFFKTETGISLIKLATAQLLPLLKTQLPEKYQDVYESIVEEFDIQSKVDVADGFINLVLETITKDDFISFKFLENEKDESTGVRANPLVLESPNTETLGVSIVASQEKEKILLEKE